MAKPVGKETHQEAESQKPIAPEAQQKDTERGTDLPACHQAPQSSQLFSAGQPTCPPTGRPCREREEGRATEKDKHAKKQQDASRQHHREDLETQQKD